MVGLLQLCQLGCQRSLAFHGAQQLLTGKLVPGSGHNGSSLVVFSQQGDGSIQLGLRDRIGTGQNDGRGRFHLVVVEFTEVLHINLHLASVCHRHGVAQRHILAHNLVDSADDIRQLAHTGGFDDHPVGMVLRNHLLQRLAEIAHQGAADTAGVHFGNVNTGILQKAAVNTDLTEFILDEHQLLTGICLLNHFLNKGSLACTQEATVNVNFRHRKHTFTNKFFYIHYTTSCQHLPVFFYFQRKCAEKTRRFFRHRPSVYADPG